MRPCQYISTSTAALAPRSAAHRLYYATVFGTAIYGVFVDAPAHYRLTAPAPVVVRCGVRVPHSAAAGREGPAHARAHADAGDAGRGQYFSHHARADGGEPAVSRPAV